MLEVQRTGEVVGRLVADREMWQVPTPLDHAQNRRVIEELMRDGSTTGPGRDDQRRHAEAAPPVRIAYRLRCRRDWCSGRRHVIEEAAPLIEVKNKYGAAPRWACRDGCVHLVEEHFAVADVGVWMVVARSAAVLAQEARVHVRHGRQRTGGAVGEEPGDRAADREVLRAPERYEWQVTEVVVTRDACRCETV